MFAMVRQPAAAVLFAAMLLILLFATMVVAQSTTSQLTGTVLDVSGAAVPDVEVKAIQVETGVATTTSSSSLGYFIFPRLQPGKYDVRVRKQGFNELIRRGVTLVVSQTTTVDLSLEVGAVTTTVNTVATVPLLEVGEATMGGFVEQSQLANLPLNGRGPFQLAALLTGIQPQSGFFKPRVFDETSFETNFTVNGGPVFSNEVLVDGTPNIAAFHGQMSWTPSVESVQEFRGLTSTYSAEFGRSGGGIISIATKSGSNAYHGSVFEYLRNTVLDANTFFNNSSGVPRQPLILNMFGGAVGGPIRRERTFFFFSYEGQRARQANSLRTTLPTAAQRRADFSQTFNSAGQLIAIYNPFSTQPGGTREPFPGNTIPSSLIDPVARQVMSYYPATNLPGEGRSGINNFISPAPLANGFNTYDARIDQNFSESNRLFVRVSWDKQTAVPANFFHNIATSNSIGPSVQPDYLATVGETLTFGPKTTLDLRLGYTRNAYDRKSESDGMDITTLGFPAAFSKAVQTPEFPQFSVSGIGLLGPFSPARYILGSNVYSFSSQLARVEGRHILRLGFEFRNYLLNSFFNGSPAFSFNQTFTQGPDALRSSGIAGYGFASFLLGTASSGGSNINAPLTFGYRYYAGYVQDDIRVSSKLTLNLGLRYDYQAPRTDRFNHLSWFSPNVANPVGPQVGLADLRGGLEFVGVNGNSRYLGNPVYNCLGPRFGFAYRLQPKTVIRGGYGITYLPNGTNINAPGGQNGFSASTPMLTSVDGITPKDVLSNPYPQGLIQPTGSSLGLLTNLGQGIAAWLPDAGIGYVQMFNLSVQRELPGNMVVQAAYVGTQGVRIPADRSYDQLPDQYLAMGSSLLKLVPNPFYGYVQQGVYSQPTIQQGYLLRPFSQFSSVTSTGNNRMPSGHSSYNSFQASVEKRFSRGLSIVGAYTNSKWISDEPGSEESFLGDISAKIQNYNNLRAERSLEPEDISQRLVINYMYDLPLGPGGRWLRGVHGPLARLAEGWRVGGITTFQTGFPLALTTATNNTQSYGGGSRPNNNGHSAKLSGSERSVDNWFNTSVFSLPEPYTFGNAGRTLSDVRSDGIRNFDFSVIKTTRVSERFNLEFHADSFNLFNTTQFAVPNTTLGVAQFGHVNGQQNGPRVIQLGLKLAF